MRSKQVARRSVLALGLLALGYGVGCGGAPPAGQQSPLAGAQSAPARPKNAGEIARQLIGGRVGALVFADKTRGHPAVGKLLGLPPVQTALGGTGLDLERDVDRAFVTAPSVRERSDVIAVLQHHLPDEQVIAALRRRIEANKGSNPSDGFVPGAGFTVARLTVRGDTRIVALPESGIAIVLPLTRVADASRFVGTGGLPDSTGPEAALLWADQPSSTLVAPHAPAVPPSVARADGAVYLEPGGGARVVVDGASSSEAQAAADAQSLTRSVDDATSVKVAFVRMRLFKPVAFRPEGTHVKADVPLSAGEIDGLVGLLATFLPG